MREIGPYRIDREIGRGGMGVVYHATHLGWGTPVAIKEILQPSTWPDTDWGSYCKSLTREAMAGRALDGNPNIVRTLDYFPNIPCIVMEYINGKTLEDCIIAQLRPSGNELSAVLVAIAGALDYAHGKGIIHRDVNARNVMITDDGITKICDFGIAKFIDRQTLVPVVTTTSGEVKGTLRSMAPEQLQGLPLGGRTDQYALAVLAHRLLTGLWIFDADNDGALVYQIVQEAPRLSSALGASTSAVFNRGLAKNPGERFPSCTQFVSALLRTIGLKNLEKTTVRRSASTQAQRGDPASRSERPVSSECSRPNLAEYLLRARLHGSTDRFRSRRTFSPDIEAVHAALFNKKYDRQAKIRVYRSWLEQNQPCVFGRIAATNKNVFICLLEEGEILQMRRGDQDLQETLQDYRQAWKRLALEGMVSSFVILLTSEALVTREPDEQLKEMCRRLIELYIQISVADDTFHLQREYVFLRRPDNTASKFCALPSLFCTQGDGRWWHDRRTPGGIMIASSALGHFICARTNKPSVDSSACVWALENAMRTISNAERDPSGGITKFTHCPATFLVPLRLGDPEPLRSGSPFSGHSPDHYGGYFHTDYLVPSAFFQRERDPKSLRRFDDLSFRYIFDPVADPVGYADFMGGVPATWYEVRSSMDRLPTFVDPETTGALDRQTRGRLAKWLEDRLRKRL